MSSDDFLQQGSTFRARLDRGGERATMTSERIDLLDEMAIDNPHAGCLQDRLYLAAEVDRVRTQLDKVRHWLAELESGKNGDANDFAWRVYSVLKAD